VWDGSLPPRIPLAIFCVAVCHGIAVFPVLADMVEVKTLSRSTAHWRIHFIRSNGWLRHSFAQLITLLDIDGIGQNWEGRNMHTSANSSPLCVHKPMYPVHGKTLKVSTLISLAFRSRVLYPEDNGGPPSNFFFF